MSNQKKLDTVHLKVDRYLNLPTSHVASKVWQTTVRRGGKNIPALQELADTKTGIERLTGDVGARVWSETVLRGGRRISVKQELADAKSGVERLEAAVAHLTALVEQNIEKESK